jgi:hypothetical protein
MVAENISVCKIPIFTIRRQIELQQNLLFEFRIAYVGKCVMMVGMRREIYHNRQDM